MNRSPRRTSAAFASLTATLLALAASGCSADTTAQGKPAAAPTVTAATADVTDPTRKQGAAKYLEIVGPHNKALDKCLPVLNPLLESGESSPSDFGKLRAVCADVPETNRQFADSLSKITWPAEARGAATQLADELRADQLAWQGVAEVRTPDDLFNPKYPLTENGPGADLMRAHLGLPTVEEEE
ncbi:hypothetical protein [Streptomyces sp. NPDC006267]|uniref:hypothetical protein n=1 Tax=Streptomyces sp. NPDC006267 TaxID=3157173 RepID=UPI00339FA5B0